MRDEPVRTFAWETKRALDSKTRTSTSMRLSLTFSGAFLKKDTPESSVHFPFFSPEMLERLFMLKEVTSSPDSKLIKLLPFDN